MLRCCLISVFTFLIFIEGFSQQYVFKHYTKENGLAGNNAYSIAQDKDGFIWIGTENGVSRFDGHSFTNFTVNDGLTDNEVLEIFSDSQGRTWFNCFTGSLCYYFKGKIYNYKNDKKISNGFVPSQVAYQNTYEDKDGNIYIAAKKSFVYPSGKIKAGYLDSITHFPPLLILSDTIDTSSACLRLSHNRDNILLYPFGNPMDTIVLTDHSDLRQQHFKKNLKMIFAGNNSFITYKSDYLSLFAIENNILSSLKVGKVSSPINRISKAASENNFWLALYNNGAQLIDKNLNLIEHILPAENVSNVLTDRDQNSWFTTLGNGFFFQSHNHVKYFDKKDGLAYNNITHLAVQNNNNLILGFREGVVQDLSGTGISPALRVSDKNFMSNDVRDYYENSSGNSYYLTERAILKKEKGSDKLISFHVSGALKAFAPAIDNSMIYISNGGAYILHENGTEDTIFLGRFTYIEKKRGLENEYWLAGIDSLYSYNGQRLTASKIYLMSHYGRIQDIASGDHNILWIATYNNGVVCLTDSQLISIKEKDGLGSNQCRKLFRENDSLIWVATNNGISRIQLNKDLTVKGIRNISSYDGLSSETITGLEKVNDVIWVASGNGLTFFNENQISYKADHSVFVTGFSVDDSSIDLAENSMQVKNGRIKIKFNGISFSSGDRLKYEYKISELDRDWTGTTLNEIELSSLKPGKYSFTVYAIDKNNIRSAEPAILLFEILPRWWQTNWFKFLLIIFSFCIVWLLFKARIKKIRRVELEKTAINKKFAELKLEAVRSQMDPHFIFNCLNAIQHFNIREDYKSAQYFMAEFAKLIRKTLNHSQRDFIVLEDAIELIEIYIKLEKLRFEDKFDYIIEKSPDVQYRSSDILVPSLIFQPYVENAINHGVRFLKADKGFLKVSFTISGNRLIAFIGDNGIGINESKKLKSKNSSEKGSFGIDLTDSRIDVINRIHDWDITQRITDKSTQQNQEKGTIVEITLPLKFK